MRRKILFAVMALLTMTTGNIWAQKAYAVLCKDGTNVNGKQAYSMHFLYTSESITTTGDTGGTVTITEGNNSKNLTYTKAYNIDIVSATISTTPNWLHDTTEKQSITQVVFEESFKNVKVKTCSSWFKDFKNFVAIEGIKNLDTSEVIFMRDMFRNCSSLTSLDLSKLNTGKVENMGYMFCDCSSLTSLNLSNFNTSSVTNMSNMFYNCSKLTSLDLSNFNTSSVTDMGNMFWKCSSLTSLDLKKFNTTNVSTMDKMFSECTSLRLLDLSQATSLNFSKMIITTISMRPLTYVPTGTTGTSGRENVVVGNKCEHLEINYGETPNNQLLLSAPYGFTAQEITINRNFTQDKPYTLCLPFAVTNTTKYGTFYKYSSYNDGKVKFTKVETTEANKPYLFVPSATLDNGIVISEATTVGVQTAETSADGKFIGVYRKTTFTGDEAKEGACYGWTSDGQGEFRRAGNGARVDACRAYIRLTAASGAPARLSIELDGGATAISTLSGADGGTDAPVYNLQGQRVSGSYKGVVIKNGKKMIVK